MDLLNKICPRYIIKNQVANAILEDLALSTDYSASLVPTKTVFAKIITRQHMILCGSAWVDEAFSNFDIKVEWLYNDGDKLYPNQTICTIKGNSNHLLTIERTALNFLQTLSATSTITSTYVNKIIHTKTIITDTRKTIPGLRLAQKYAVLMGGGYNQRLGLYDGVLIKENHIKAFGSVGAILQHAYINTSSNIPIQIEVENINQFEEAMKNGAKSILLDNMSIEDIAICVKSKNNTILEASGGIHLDNIIDYANTGVDRISIGNITKNIKAIDLSMLFE